MSRGISEVTQDLPLLGTNIPIGQDRFLSLAIVLFLKEDLDVTVKSLWALGFDRNYAQ